MLLFLTAQLFVCGCMLKRLPSDQAVSKEVVKEVESKVYDTSVVRAALKFKEVSGYYLRNGVKLTREINFFNANSQKKFDEYLGKSSLNTSESGIDFKKNAVAFIVTKSSSEAYDIKISSVYCVGSDIYCDYEIFPGEISGKGYFTPEIKILAIEKPQNVTNIAFVNPERKITVLPFGNRNIFSPASLDDLKKYYTGIYKGTIPAADGPGILMNLNLKQDNTYTLQETYIDRYDKAFESSGKWAPTEDLSSFVLDYDKDPEEQIRFYFLDRNTVEKLDIYGEKINSELYKLKK
jgi:hypothetical protein